MKSQIQRRWPVIAVTACLLFTLAIATTAVSIGLASIEPVQQEQAEKVMGKVNALVQASGRPLRVTEETFDDQVLKSNVPVLVDFWAEWCGPCHVQAPILAELASEVDKAKIATVDVDENPQLAARYGIRSLPTLLVFRNGEEAARHEGVASKEELKRLLAAG